MYGRHFKKRIKIVHRLDPEDGEKSDLYFFNKRMVEKYGIGFISKLTKSETRQLGILTEKHKLDTAGKRCR